MRIRNEIFLHSDKFEINQTIEYNKKEQHNIRLPRYYCTKRSTCVGDIFKVMHMPIEPIRRSTFLACFDVLR